VQSPVETIGCTATASVVLVAFLSRRFRQTLGPARPHAIFLFFCIAAGFVPCWISPGGKTRYLMGIYPAVAALSGLAVDRIAQGDLAGWLRATLSWGQRSLAVSALGAAAVVGWLAWSADGIVYGYWKQPGWLAITFLAVAIAVAWLNWLGPFARGWARCAQAISLAGLLGLLYGGVIINQLMARQSGAETVMAEVKQILPANSRLVSLDPIHHKLVFLYGQPIEMVRWNEPDRIPPGSYFCFNRYAIDDRQIPFAHEELAILNMDRIDCPNQETTYVVFARRLGTNGKELQTALK
jgi:hypothetical protein